MLIPFFICLFVALIAFSAVYIARRNRAWRGVDAARKAYNAMEKEHDSFYAREHCPHKVVVYYRGGNPGIFTFYLARCTFCNNSLERCVDPYKIDRGKDYIVWEINGNPTLIRVR